MEPHRMARHLVESLDLRASGHGLGRRKRAALRLGLHLRGLVHARWTRYGRGGPAGVSAHPGVVPLVAQRAGECAWRPVVREGVDDWPQHRLVPLSWQRDETWHEVHLPQCTRLPRRPHRTHRGAPGPAQRQAGREGAAQWWRRLRDARGADGQLGLALVQAAAGGRRCGEPRGGSWLGARGRQMAGAGRWRRPQQRCIVDEAATAARTQARRRRRRQCGRFC
mmetsp:Transcript_52262/g.169803  ORF Transcript_52262/g.169803 Transcript_52262/m.169803 type:complete len:223 (+) Transcript_52262:896-1564(+)